MAPFDRSHTTFYWSAIVNTALSCTVLSYLTLNNIVTLKSGLELIQGHSNFKLVPFESLGAVSYSPSIVTMAVSLTVYEIFSVKEWRDPETAVGVVQGH